MSELVEKTIELLTNTKNDLEEKLKTLNEEYEGLVSINHKQTHDDKKRIKELIKEVASIGEALEEVNNDLKYISDLTDEIEEIKDEISKMSDGKRKRNVEKDLESKEIELQEFCENKIENDYDLLNSNKSEKKSSKFNKKQVAISAVALLMALGIGFGIGKINFKGNNNHIDNSLSDTDDDKDKDNDKELEDKNDDKNKEEEQTEEQAPLFTDINDEEQLYTRANEILPYFTTLVPAQNMTVDEVAEFLKYINNGVVENPNYDSAAFVIDSINDLMFSELGSAPHILNEVETIRGTSPIFIDYGKFFIDGSQGQKLAIEISALRSSMIAGAGGDITNLRKEFTELFMNSWMLKGNNGSAINAYTLETSGHKALIDLMFLNTSSLCGDASLVTVSLPINGEEITLYDIQTLANYEGCPTTLDDGTIITLDKSSSDLYAMYQQAVITKQNTNSLIYN